MNIKEQIEEYMKANGYTAIANRDMDCGCTFDDLFPCDGLDPNECEFAYTKPCVRDEAKCGECDSSGPEDGECITLDKPG